MGDAHLYSVDSKGTATPPPSGPSATETAPRRMKRARPKYPVPTDRMAFDVQVKALNTIVSASRGGQEAVDADAMGGLMGIAPVTAVLNNSFFVSVGLLEKVGKGDYKPTPIAVSFQRKWSFGDKAGAPLLLAPAFIDTWFFDTVKQKVELDDTTTVKDMVQVLASVAETDKTYATQYGFLLKWLEFVGLISMDDGVIKVLRDDSDPEPSAVIQEKPKPDVVKDEKVTPPGEKSTTATSGAPPLLSLSIEVVVTADDVAKLSAEQIASLFEGVGKVAAVKAALKKD